MRRFSLSVRIAEGFLSKEIPILGLESVAQIAKQCGYSAVCMRGSQVGVHSTEATMRTAVELLAGQGLAVSMLTGDFDTVYNNDRAPAALRNIKPYLDLAEMFQAGLVRVALKSSEDIPWAQRAADQASERGIRLVHQCHTLSMFETVDSIVDTLTQIDRPNFGLIYEPANLELCGQDYGLETIKRLEKWMFNVYLQNQVVRDHGSVRLDTWCRGPVQFDLIPIHAGGGIKFDEVFAALDQIGYNGYLTVHQSATEGETPAASADRTFQFLQQW